MRKRIIALLLALILTVGLLPTVALAAGETENNDVVPGKYVNGVWTKGDLTQTLPAGVKSINKTATKTGDNTYDVTLEVVLKQTEENSGKAATVLVLDTSGSMAYCAECGTEGDCVHNYVKFNGTPNSKGQYYYKTTDKNGKEEFERAYYCDRKHILPNKKHTAGWFTTSGDSIWHDPQTDSLAGQTIYVKSPTPRASRLDAAKVAAENFLKTYSGLTFKADGTPADNQNNRNLGRYVSVVSFATKAESVQSWVDVSNSDVYKEVLKNIKRLNANGGTNLDAGLTYAEYLLKQTTVNDAVKNVIALTDGQPTFFIDTNERAYNDDGLTGLDREFLTIDNTTYRVHGTGDSCNAKTFTETVASADAVKNHAKLYTVCFDAEEKIDVPNNGGQISVSEYLSTKIATQPTKTGEQFAYDADNAEKLYAEFAKITQSIVSGLNNGTVRDTLPTGITSAAFGEDNVKEWKLNEKPFTKNETTNTVDGKQVTTYTYTYTYTVTINPLTVEKTEIDGAYYAPLNGETTLTVGSGADAKEIPFPIPAGKVTMPSYTVTFKDGANEAVFKDETQQVEYGKPIPSHADPVRPGYNFTGWTSEPANYQPGTGTMPANNITFTAQWTEKGSVTINYVAKTGGTVTRASETLNPDTGTAAGSTATPNADYAFAGWYSDPECTEAKKVGSNVDFTPTKPEGGWVTTTYYAKFEQIQVNVNLSPYVKKTLEVDGTLPTGFSETFKVDVTVDGQRLQQQGTVTMTADGTSNFSMPTVTLTCGVHTIVVQEVVAPQTKNSNIAYGTNPESFVLNVTASGVQYGSTDSEENFVVVTGSPFVTITNKYTQPTETFDLNTLITKNFEARTDSKPIPNGNYTFTAQIFEADDTWQQVGESPVYTGTATLNGAASGAAFDFDSSSNPTLASGTHRYLVKEEHGGETIDGITYDSTVYRLTITVSEDGTQPNVQIEAEPQASVLSVQSVEFTSKIIFTNTYFEEKDPNKCTIDFSKFVKKELTATGSKTVDEATFIVDVVGSYDGEAIANALTPTEMQATTDEDVLNTTLTASIKNIVGGNVYEEPFTGSVTVSKPGHYTFTLTERKGTQSGVTYDEAHYQVFVNIMRVGDNLVIHDATTYLNNEQVELIKLENDVPVTAGYIVFKNTIDTGKDDYYPIIIPTIINKDTGMLNKTDHFAYVIGYPDGTVHPNGQITRAEVATIFFRLLRDEVRDGAFTTSNTYSDVAYGKWYNNPISTMSALGIITGYPDGTFKPNKPITRAEFAAIAARFDETQSGKSATFSDVIGHWAAKEIGIAYYNDWIKGYPDGTFKPDQNITRAEAMTLINRVLERKPESPADLLTNMNKWTDNMDTSKWYYLDVQEATNSHGYTRKTFNYELWRQMLPDPDWSRYER